MGIEVVNEEQQRFIEMGIAVAKDRQKEELIKAVNLQTKELHELNKTLKLIAGRLK